MGKVVKFTGSRLLGAELRRLRGGRTLDDMVDLGRSKLIAHGFKAVAKGSLSDIENGKTLPNLESLFALSVLYQVPASRFVHVLLEENVAATLPDPGDDTELHARFVAAAGAGQWPDALGWAAHGTRQALAGWPGLRWRLNRAVALGGAGLRLDAINEFNACLEDPALPASERFKVLRELSRMHAGMGHLHLAVMHLLEAEREMPPDSAPELKARLIEARISLALRRRAWPPHERAARLDEVDGWIREARLISAGMPAEFALTLDLYQTEVLLHRGQALRALKAARQLVVRAEKLELPLRQADALLLVADSTAALDRHADARKTRTRAGDLAVEQGAFELAFEAFLALVTTAESSEQRAHFYRKCQRLYPLLEAGHPCARDFEKLRATEVE